MDDDQGDSFLVEKRHRRLLCWSRRAAFSPRTIYGVSCRRDGGETQISFTSPGREDAVHRNITQTRERPSFMPRWYKDGKQGDYCRAPRGQASSGNGGKRAQLEGANQACRGQHCSAPARRQNL